MKSSRRSSPESVVGEFAALLKSYRVTKVTGDRYAGELLVPDADGRVGDGALHRAAREAQRRACTSARPVA